MAFTPAQSWREILPGLCAVLSGILFILATPPFEWSWLVWVAFVPFLYGTRDERRPAKVALYGMLWGLPVFITCGVGLFAFHATVFVLVPLVLALLVAAVFAAQRALSDETVLPALRVMLLPSLWVLAEVASSRSNVPWSIAIAVARDTAVIQVASLFGMFAVSFLILLANTGLYWLTVALGEAAGRRRGRGRDLSGAIVAAVVVALGIGYGFSTSRGREPDATDLKIATLQPMIEPDVYRYQGYNPAYRQTLLRVFGDLSAQAARGGPDVIVWPEGGNGQFNFRIPVRRREITELARRSRASLLVSSYDLDENGRLFNSVFSVSPSGELLGRYAKSRLTPVGESEFTPGSKLVPLPTRQGPVGALVCFESAFPWPARSLAQEGAQMLVISTSDVSFRNSSLPFLHSRAAIFRAVENRLPVVHASNGGPSLMISAYGEVLAESGFLERTVLTETLALPRGATLYGRLGDWPLLAFAVAVLLLARWSIRRSSNDPETERAPGLARRDHPEAGARLVPWALLFASAVSTGVVAGSISIWLTSRGIHGVGDSWRTAAQAFVAPPVYGLSRRDADVFLQSRRNTCGVAALAYLMSYLGHEVGEKDLLPDVRLRPEGAAMDSLANAARSRGFLAWGEWQNFEALKQAPKPVIAHFRDDHYVVVLAVGPKEELDVFDPAVGYVRISAADFQKSWAGYVLVVRFSPLPEVDGSGS